MAKRKIYITTQDRARIESLLCELPHSALRGETDHVDLEQELKSARIVEPKKVPPTVVTMRSRVVLSELESGARRELTLVYPNEADVDRGKISVLSPVGKAILGYSTGDTVAWKVPTGVKHFRVEQVLYQPEAAGHYQL
ncbi:MAG: nucleoside diphosphate kinase regulator [Candidatus Hydrogenedentes bacterium]|nr:nucleoside diphosphate kinase regulator [Candidatus Hydrogenedentota bacterium]